VPRLPRIPPHVLPYLLLALLAGGYRWGVADHGIHAAFVEMLGRQGDWAADVLALAFPHHHSVFWHVQALPARVLGLPLLQGLLWVSCVAATGALVHLIARSAWDSRRGPETALLLLFAAHPVPGGVATLDPLLLNRTAALPLELLSLWLLGMGRAAGAFVVLGVAACVHVPSAAALGFAMGIAQLAAARRFGLRELLAPFGFVVAALPVLLPWLLSGAAEQALRPMDGDWWAIVQARLAHHVDPRDWPISIWFQMLAWIGLGLAGARLRPRDGFGEPLLAVALGLLLWAGLAGGLLGAGMRLPLLLQLEPWQGLRLLLILCALSGAAWLGEMRTTDKASEWLRILLVLLFAARAPLPAVAPLLMLLLAERRGVAAAGLRLQQAAGAWTAVLLGAAVLLHLLGPLLPGLRWAPLLGLDDGVAGPPRPGWFFDAGPAVLLVLALALLAWRSWRADSDLWTPEQAFRAPSPPARLAALAGLALALGWFPASGQERSRLEPIGETGEEAAIARWARKNAARDEAFAVPPQAFASFRALARRPALATWKDGGESLFSRDFALEWKRRIERLCDCRPLDAALPRGAEPGVRLAELRRRIDDGMHRRDAAALARDAEALGARWLVLRRFDPTPAFAGGEPALRTVGYQVWRLPAGSAGP
jgi:hypothetical protein